ncbi:DUF5991 domain-containing protein [Chitinophaga solisilvae]|uniref:DUF5991 domain-containing protein n=1 Tax=Chitinophaga solisilvae TaxID=1233460 RepID=UPI00136C3F6D|nr:DUF5991 domain-containing protein [Chitinophaga solisilvae]
MKTNNMLRPLFIITLFISITACKSQTSNSKVSNRFRHNWDNTYTLHTESGETLNGFDVFYDYTLIIHTDSATFSLIGIQAGFRDKCFLSEKDDTLLGNFAYDLDGYETSHDQFHPLFKIFKKDNAYYIISPIIAPMDSNKIWHLKTSLPPGTTTTQKNQ